MEIVLIVVTSACLGALIWDLDQRAKRISEPTARPARSSVRVIPPVFDQEQHP